ncbi:hypothetical protein [Actinophytocola sediminis]
MKYIKIEKFVGSWRGYSLDPDAYLAILPEIEEELPEGARAFATDPGHYDFFGSQCVKDLKFGKMEVCEGDGGALVALRLFPNEFKHDSGLLITYRKVLDFKFEASRDNAGYVQLDEVLPHEEGFTHEIQMTGGKLWVMGEDPVAQWLDPELDL